MKPAAINRRLFLAGLPLVLGACMQGGAGLGSGIPRNYRSMYAAVDDGPHAVPAIDLSQTDPRYWRQPVAFAGPEDAGEIVVDPERRFLYLVEDDGTAMRYGVGVGRAGFSFRGKARVARKAEWPRWTPTQNMQRREPDRYRAYLQGLDGGVGNPLGARALYLHRDGRDTLYRIHGTNEAGSIGREMSSGCIRMFNQDVMDLYERVPTGTLVTVLSPGSLDRTEGGSASA